MLIKYESILWNSSKCILKNRVLSLSLRALEIFSTESVWWELRSMSGVCILLSTKLHTWRPRVFSTETLWNCFISPTLPHALFLSLSDLSLNQPFLTKHQLFFFFFRNISCVYLSPFYYSRQFFFLLQPHLNVTLAVETQSPHAWWWTVQMHESFPILQKWNLPAIAKWSFLGKYCSKLHKCLVIILQRILMRNPQVGDN